MKKQYIQPALDVVCVKYNSLLMASLGVASGTLNANDALGHENDDDFDW